MAIPLRDHAAAMIWFLPLRSARSARLEGRGPGRPSFETRPAGALRMRRTNYFTCGESGRHGARRPQGTDDRRLPASLHAARAAEEPDVVSVGAARLGWEPDLTAAPA